MSSYRTFTATTFSTLRDFAAAVEAGTVTVTAVAPAGKLYDVTYVCPTDTYATVGTLIRVNKTTAKRVGALA